SIRLIWNGIHARALTYANCGIKNNLIRNSPPCSLPDFFLFLYIIHYTLSLSRSLTLSLSLARSIISSFLSRCSMLSSCAPLPWRSVLFQTPLLDSLPFLTLQTEAHTDTNTHTHTHTHTHP